MILEPKSADINTIVEAVNILKQGGLVAFPTETVYGLGADAGNSEAVNKIFTAKGRPADHPLIVHIGTPEQLSDWAQNIPPSVWELAAKFWPGPLTMVLQKHPHVPLVVTGGQQTVALRIPDNPVALALLKRFGGGVAAPSANRFNHISPTLAEHVCCELGESIDMILDGGACSVGLESTIIDLTGSQAKLLRPGHITPQQITEILHTSVTVPQKTAIRAPGMLKMHYAPTTPTVMSASDKIQQQIEKLLEQGKRVGVLAHCQFTLGHNNSCLLQMPIEADDYGQALYAALRKLDRMQLDVILVEQLPEDDSWLAVNDRLKKATAANRI